jgi:hypothetical protein
MPTYDALARFVREYKALSRQDRAAFRRAKSRYVAALKAGRPFEAGLGITEMGGHPGVFEFHFSNSGRATFHYGSEARGVDAYVIWHRIGGHEIYREP